MLIPTSDFGAELVHIDKWETWLSYLGDPTTWCWFLYYYYVAGHMCTHVCMMCVGMCAMECVWRSEDSCVESFLSLHFCMSSGTKSRVCRHAQQAFLLTDLHTLSAPCCLFSTSLIPHWKPNLQLALLVNVCLIPLHPFLLSAVLWPNLQACFYIQA